MPLSYKGWAVITGATSGIGQEFSRRLAINGMSLLITGRRTQLLEQRASELKELGASAVTVISGELADAQIVEDIANFVASQDCTVLINNAGFGTTGPVHELSYDQLRVMEQVLVSVPVRLCNAVLPRMRANGRGLIINVGSLAGNVAVPDAATYVASKSFLERFSESVALENIDSGVVVQALTPGFVKTDFHRDVTDYRSRQQSRGLIRWLEPAEVVDLSLRRAETAARRLSHGAKVPSRKHTVVIPGFWNRFLFATSRLVPRRMAYRGALSRARL